MPRLSIAWVVMTRHNGIQLKETVMSPQAIRTLPDQAPPRQPMTRIDGVMDAIRTRIAARSLTYLFRPPTQLHRARTELRLD